MSAVDVRGLRIAFGRGRAHHEVVHDVTLAIEEGETVGIVGESGSGKSVTARALVGLVGEGSAVRAQTLRVGGRDLDRASERDWRALRGSQVGFVLQDALVSLDPLRTVGAEIEEPLREHRALTRAQRIVEVERLLRDVGVPEPEIRRQQRPHELSGGLRQRALIASAIAAKPQLLILDEATTALDVTVQAQILRLLQTFKDEGRTLLVISHDLAVVSSIADRVVVMRDGRVVEAGTTAEVLGEPKTEYTRSLLEAIPSERPPRPPLVAGALPTSASTRSAARRPVGEVVAEARGLVRRFTAPGGRPLTAVDDVSITLRAGRTLGLVGESGSGKSTVGRLLLGLDAPDAGDVLIGGTRWSDVRGRDDRALRRRIQAIHQDPLSSFDPRHPVDRILDEAVRASGVDDRRRRRDRVAELLDQVRLASSLGGRRPFQLSGGQRQRVAIARALALEPEVIVGDEPVSALDVSIQAQVLDLIAEVQRDTNVAILLISHDLGVIRAVSDEVAVLRDGRIVEHDSVGTIFGRPSSAYARELLAAVPTIHHRPVTATDTRETSAR